jgi:hypothetical protein
LRILNLLRIDVPVVAVDVKPDLVSQNPPMAVLTESRLMRRSENSSPTHLTHSLRRQAEHFGGYMDRDIFLINLQVSFCISWRNRGISG